MRNCAKHTVRAGFLFNSGLANNESGKFKRRNINRHYFILLMVQKSCTKCIKPGPMGGDKLPTSTWLPGLSWFPIHHQFSLAIKDHFLHLCVAILFYPKDHPVLTPLFFTPQHRLLSPTPSWAEWTKHNWPGEKQPGQSTVWNESCIMATTN